MNTNPMARIRQDVQSMHAYAIQDATGMVKLDAMENPFALPLPLQAELGRRLGAVAINRYPGARVEDLKRALERHIQLPAGHALMLGNGSDELISLLAMGCDLPGATILAPLPGFVMYAMSAQLQGLRFEGVPLTADFELDEAAMLAAMRAHQPAITYLAYPNNPTANLWDAATVRRLIAEAATFGGLVVIDEAYQPFSSRTWLDEMRAHPEANAHVLLMRTLSKFGLAGVRIGYLVGPQALVQEFDKLRPPYNVSVLNAECALFALEHAAEFAEQAATIRDQREQLIGALAAMPGVTPFPSQANMVLVRVPDAKKAFDALKAQRVLVKNVSTMHPLLAQCLRLTVGTPDENAQLLRALQSAL
ncbi:MAG: histidinol-phosphate transaminase [Hydrogenophaga sp.]|uniref:histidinol-phosphate transaminase n=1 Tax=Hydrogenophaga sp. TaxID=1904254 RepID=UPI001DB828C4|nr:histidinol-phosphate transaminase [Hydrogenophaga sp.]MBX3611741.1 histidinol-phosphate transaminase [Hydrogenophaga sp.]